MSGYKRVNFYELCRLCATNQQKEKTHIFQEEGRKIQLQNKIQSCLSLKVCENDFLPKVVCSQCLRTLEECSTFRKECYTSETMLSSYFNNFRYTDDFKKSGKVYIKDTSPKVVVTTEMPTTVISSPVPSTSAITTAVSNGYNVNVVPTSAQTHLENVPYYTLHLPQLPQEKLKEKMVTQPHIVYNLNTIKTVLPNNKPNINETISNVTVNANGEIINIAPLVDMDSLINQNVIQKQHKKTPRKNRILDNCSSNKNEMNNMIKIDLTTQPEIDLKRDLIKLQQNKVNQYIVNPVENINRSYNQPVIMSQTTRTKTYTNLFNVSNIPIATPEAITHLNPEPPPMNINNLPMNTFNTIQQYPTTRQEDCQDGISLGNIHYNPNTIIRQHFTTDQNFSQPINMEQPPSPPQQPLIQAPAPQQQHPKEVEGNSQVCDICCKTFKRREHLLQHVKLHSGFRPFKCENCNKSFMRKEHLLRHMTSHSGQKNYSCDVCDKSFSRNDNLLKHKKIHNKQGAYTCEVCQKQFVMEHYYIVHKHTHHDVEKCNVNPAWGLLKAV